jgi:hypothetical protein
MSSAYKGPNRIEILHMLGEFNRAHPNHMIKFYPVQRSEIDAVEKLRQREKSEQFLWHINYFVRYLRDLKRDTASKEADKWSLLVKWCEKILAIAKSGRVEYHEKLTAHDARLAADLNAQYIIEQKAAQRDAGQGGKAEHQHHKSPAPAQAPATLHKNETKHYIRAAAPQAPRKKKSNPALQAEAVTPTPLR